MVDISKYCYEFYESKDCLAYCEVATLEKIQKEHLSREDFIVIYHKGTIRILTKDGWIDDVVDFMSTVK